MSRPEDNDRYWGKRALDFVDAVERATSPTEITDLFNREIAQAGFGAYVMVGLSDVRTDFRKRMIANGWPREWSHLYLRENLAKFDPVERHCLRSIEPFDWSQAPYDPEHDPMAKSVMTRAVDFGMAQGFCVPIHYGDGSGAAVSIAGERPDFGRGIRPAMHLMAIYAHHRIRSLVKPPASRGHILTPREREVLRWVAVGCTSAEIGDKLTISETTVIAHIIAAQRKLGAVNRVSTVVNAIRTGEIIL